MRAASPTHQVKWLPPQGLKRAPRGKRGWLALLLCGVLIQGTALSLALVQRWAVDRERLSWLLWAHAQAQALGQAGLMWTLARLEDPRPIDQQCRALGMPQSSGTRTDTFAARMAVDGRTLRCLADLGPDAPMEPWRCDCTGAAATPSGSAWPNQAQGALEITFSGSNRSLGVRVKAQVQLGLDTGPAWQESVRLETDRHSIWRAVVGSWQDGR
ncbi:MAG: hypothetical protein FJY26_05505 [Betaproteobacteria bacterium]|nr:hypothetical protein [Betaproteobacteria bacterium]